MGNKNNKGPGAIGKKKEEKTCMMLYDGDCDGDVDDFNSCSYNLYENTYTK
jgi:hypothetical protein